MSELESTIKKYIPHEKELEAVCLEPKWVERKLCELGNLVSSTDKEKTRDRILEAAGVRKWLMSEEGPEKEADKLILVIKGEDGKYLLFSIPQSFGQERVFQASHKGKVFTFEAVPKTNGYNTEYIIKDSNGKAYEQLALLFSATNPAWKKSKKILDAKIDEIKTLENELKTIIQKIANLKKMKKGPHREQSALEERRREIEKILPVKKRERESGKIELKKQDRYIDFPYTPYNQLADTPTMREQGFSYLNQSVKHAWEDDGLARVRSFVGAKESVPKTYPSEIALVLNIVERMDYKTYFLHSGKLKESTQIEAIMRGQINKALTTFALNGNNAFNWQRSGVGALGIGQFMPGTYAGLQKNYPSVVGEGGFEVGAKDHGTSFKMQALHFHEESRAFPSEIRKGWDEIMKDPKARISMYALIAAGYNGDIRRVISEALGSGGGMKALLSSQTLKENLEKNTETLTYVMKFVFVWNYLKSTYKGFDNN